MKNRSESGLAAPRAIKLPIPAAAAVVAAQAQPNRSTPGGSPPGSKDFPSPPPSNSPPLLRAELDTKASTPTPASTPAPAPAPAPASTLKATPTTTPATATATDTDSKNEAALIPFLSPQLVAYKRPEEVSAALKLAFEEEIRESSKDTLLLCCHYLDRDMEIPKPVLSILEHQDLYEHLLPIINAMETSQIDDAKKYVRCHQGRKKREQTEAKLLEELKEAYKHENHRFGTDPKYLEIDTLLKDICQNEHKKTLTFWQQINPNTCYGTRRWEIFEKFCEQKFNLNEGDYLSEMEELRNKTGDSGNSRTDPSILKGWLLEKQAEFENKAADAQLSYKLKTVFEHHHHRFANKLTSSDEFISQFIATINTRNAGWSRFFYCRETGVKRWEILKALCAKNGVNSQEFEEKIGAIKDESKDAQAQAQALKVWLTEVLDCTDPKEQAATQTQSR